MGNGMEVLHGSVWKNDSEITVRVDPLVPGGLHLRALLYLRPIFSMNPLQELLPSGNCFLGVIAVNAKYLLRPEQTAGAQVPGPTPRVAQPLRFGQVGFAASQLLSHDFVFSDVDGAADILFDVLIGDKRNTDGTNVADLAIGSHDALGGVEGRIFRHQSVDQIRHGMAVLRMDETQIFLHAGRLARRIKTVHPK